MKEQIIKDYMTYRKIECKNTSALTNYERYIKTFLDKTDNTLSNLDEVYLTNHINEVSEKFSQTSLNNIKPLFKNFIKWKFPDYPTRFRNLDKLCKTKRAKATYSAKQMLKEDEIKKLIAGETSLFWKIFWMIFFYGGFRGIDTIRLRWDMFDMEQEDKIIIIKTFIGKNKKEFYKSLPPELYPMIKKWREVNLTDWLFPSSKGDCPIHPKSPNQRLSKLSKKILGKHINPYILRHSYGSLKYNEKGIDKDIIADQMGHSEDMQETYMNLNDEEKIERAKRVQTNKREMPEEERVSMQKEIEDLKARLEGVTAWQKTFQKNMVERNNEILKGYTDTLEKKPQLKAKDEFKEMVQ